MSLRDRAKQLYTRAMASEFAPLEQLSWESLTWMEQRWWEHIAALKSGLSR